MLTPTYTLAAATQVPPLIAPVAQALLNKADKAPPNSPLLGQPPYATSSGLVDWGLILAANLDAVGRYGAGVYGVAKGLELQADGTSLSYTVTAGASILDSEVVLAADTVRAADPGVYTWVWQTTSGSIQVGTGANPNAVPAAPAAICAFLGRIDATNGSAITAVDYSGRPQLRGGVLWRQTGDLQAPGDSPPATLLFWARTLGGTYVWDGQAYSLVSNTVAAVAAVLFASFEQRVLEVEQAREADQRAFRRLLFFVADAFKKIPPGLETQFQLATRER